MMYLATIILCTTMAAESCYTMINNRRMFGSYDECIQEADLAAQTVMRSGEVYFASPACYPIEFGEPA